MSSVTRRTFLKDAAIAGAAAASGMLGGPLSATRAYAAPNVPAKWDKEADVVVVGYSGAGAATAITAKDAGASVVILEKMAQGGGNTGVSGGGYLCPKNVDDAVKYITQLFAFTASEMDKDLVLTYVQEAVKNTDWVKGLRAGTNVIRYGGAGYPKLAGADSIDKWQVVGADAKAAGGSLALWDLLSYAVEKERKIEVLFSTPAKQLITNDKGEVVGVYADAKGTQIAVKAKRAVVLTTGGYENDPAMLKSHTMGWPIYFLGTPGNTGDGIRMAEKVGAAIWHMNGLSCPLGFKAPEFEAAFMAGVPGASYIYVNKYGERFVNEKGPEGHAWYLAVNSFNDEVLGFPAIPCYAIFDETVRLTGPVAGSTIGWVRGKYTWSKDNSEEIKKGWIVQGATIRELATKLKMDPTNLELAVAKWNRNVKDGADTEYHRPVKGADEKAPAVSAPIEKGPFYAIEFNPALLNTQGGPRRNVKGQIVDPYGAAIPRLYSAGELGCMWGIVYQGSGNVGECFTFGRISGKNAAAEKPWDAAV